MILGEIDNRMSERLEQLRHILEVAGIETRSTDNIRDQIWTKIAANLTSNPLSVVTSATLEQIYSDTHLSPLVRQIFNEVIQVAAAHGARIRFDPQTFMELGAGMGAVKTSMLQDHEQGSPLELAAIGHAVIELAERVGLSMPTTRHILALTEFMARTRHSAQAA